MSSILYPCSDYYKFWDDTLQRSKTQRYNFFCVYVVANVVNAFDAVTCTPNTCEKYLRKGFFVVACHRCRYLASVPVMFQHSTKRLIFKIKFIACTGAEDMFTEWLEFVCVLGCCSSPLVCVYFPNQTDKIDTVFAYIKFSLFILTENQIKTKKRS